MHRHVTFLCGRGGVYALGAVAANYRGDHQRRDLFLSLFLEVSTNLQLSSLTNKVIDVFNLFSPSHGISYLRLPRIIKNLFSPSHGISYLRLPRITYLGKSVWGH